MLRKMSLKGKVRDQRGFTLIEIIAVLVILAVLAVVAVPKYLSTIGEAKNKAAMGAVAEAMGRTSQWVASYMLANNGNVPSTINSTIFSDMGDFTITLGTLASGTFGITASAVSGNAQGGTASGVGRMPQ